MGRKIRSLFQVSVIASLIDEPQFKFLLFCLFHSPLVELWIAVLLREGKEVVGNVFTFHSSSLRRNVLQIPNTHLTTGTQHATIQNSRREKHKKATKLERLIPYFTTHVFKTWKANLLNFFI